MLSTHSSQNSTFSLPRSALPALAIVAFATLTAAQNALALEPTRIFLSDRDAAVLANAVGLPPALSKTTRLSLAPDLEIQVSVRGHSQNGQARYRYEALVVGVPSHFNLYGARAGDLFRFLKGIVPVEAGRSEQPFTPSMRRLELTELGIRCVYAPQGYIPYECHVRIGK